MNNKGLNVLSLFDGISCGMLALQRVGIEVNRYCAYEIDKYAIQISKKNFPNIEHFGDVVNADFSQFKGFDLIIGGSPCQDLSCMGSRQGLDGNKSKLFYEFVRALKECCPKYFLLENNASMTKENKEKITNIIGVNPIFINSVDFSAQHRKRLYWTNIPVDEWTPKNIVLENILQPIESKQDFLITDKVNKYLSKEYNNRKYKKPYQQR
jgi:DNA-cytosine methyltransferase